MRLIEQVLMGLPDELEINPYRLIEDQYSRYLLLVDGAGTHLMFIMVTDYKFWLYKIVNDQYVLDRILGIDCPTLIDEIYNSIIQAIERQKCHNLMFAII